MTSLILAELERLLEQRNKLNGKLDTSNILESLSFAMTCSVFLTPSRILALIDAVKALEKAETALARDYLHSQTRLDISVALSNLNSQFQ